MQVKVEDRKEGGWMVVMRDGVFNTYRYILPEGDRFIVINPFKIESHFADVESFDTAVSIAEASAKNSKLKYDQN
jgi:hypothetical protein